MKSGSKYKNRIILRTPEGLQPFFLYEILYCEADGNYTLFHIVGRVSATIICQTLKKTEQELHSKDFFRTDKSYLVNLPHIKTFKRGISIIVLDNDEQVPVSRRNKKKFLITWKGSNDSADLSA